MARTTPRVPRRRPATFSPSPMPMPTPGTRRSGSTEQTQKAWRAVRQFTTMIPTFTSFARVMTGNQGVRVQVSKSGARSDGKTIWIQPPIALGEELVHQRSLCDRRGENKLQLCPACAAREEVVFNLFHEIGHVAFNSVTPPIGHVLAKFEELVTEWHPDAACSHGAGMKQSGRASESYREMCAMHNGYLSVLLNTYEDARVNARMFQARPGLRVMFSAGTRKVFETGVESHTGERRMWREASLNSQIIIGVLLLASGYGIPDGYLSEEAAEILKDEKLNKLAARAVKCPSVHEIALLSIDTFRHLNEMGFCLVPKCEVPPPPPPSLPNEADDEEHDGDQSDADGEPSETGDDGSAPQARDEPATGGGGSSGSDDSDDDVADDSLDESESNGDGSGSDEADGSDQSDDLGRGTGDDARGDDGDAEDQQSSGSSGTSPEPATDAQWGDDWDSGSSTESGDGGTGNPGSRQGSEEPEEDGEGDAEPSTDPVLRGTDDSHVAPESEDGSEAGSPPRGAGAGNGGRGEDSGADDDPSESSEGGSSDDAEPDDDPDFEDDGSPVRSGDPGGEGSLDVEPETGMEVSEDVWNDPANSEAVERQEALSLEEPGSDFEEPDFGSEDEVSREIAPFVAMCDEPAHRHDGGIGHTDPSDDLSSDSSIAEDPNGEAAFVRAAVIQSEHFDTSRVGVGTLIEVDYPHGPSKWMKSYLEPKHFMPAESILGRAVMEARLAFEDNKRAHETRNLKSGRLDRRAIGKRAPLGDPRMFQKKTRPGKKDYFFAIGVDISGSTGGFDRLPRILRSVFAQATLLSRLGHQFAIYGMTGGRNLNDLRDPHYWMLNDVWIYNVKRPNEPWSAATQQRLADLKPCNENFDGHNMEFLRKVLDTRTETTRGIIYYTDGAMPARNEDEEIIILTNELQMCKRKGYTVMGVGINTDSPTQYGLNTVRVDSDDDIVKVTRQLGAYLKER